MTTHIRLTEVQTTQIAVLGSRTRQSSIFKEKSFLQLISTDKGKIIFFSPMECYWVDQPHTPQSRPHAQE